MLDIKGFICCRCFVMDLRVALMEVGVLKVKAALSVHLEKFERIHTFKMYPLISHYFIFNLFRFFLILLKNL